MASQGRRFEQDTNPNNMSHDTIKATQSPLCQTNDIKNQTDSDSEHGNYKTCDDELLFQQPKCTHLGDCPICCLPLTQGKYSIFFFECCSKKICGGCWVANCSSRLSLKKITKPENEICMFCRTPATDKKDIRWDRLKKRIEVGDPIAMTSLGNELFDEGDYLGAFVHFSKAAALGYIDAHVSLSRAYSGGAGVKLCEAIMVHHLEQAAIGGHPHARYRLAMHEEKNGRMDRAAKHCLISAKLGHNDALNTVKECYRSGIVSKEDFAAALRGHQAAIDATKSDQRTRAEEICAKIERSESAES